MKTNELRLGDLVGRKVRDASGRVVGRVVEMSAEVVLREQRRDYVVHGFHVASHGVLAPLSGLRFVQELASQLGHIVGYKRFSVPWDAMDLGDPRRPRLLVELRDEWLAVRD